MSKPSLHISTELLTVDKCNEFAVFFSDKTGVIRGNIERIRPQNLDINAPQCTIQSICLCFLLLIPFLQHCILVVGRCPKYYQSFLFIFPQCLQIAIVGPLLKKSNLDGTVLSNYRPVSNLPFVVVSVQL